MRCLLGMLFCLLMPATVLANSTEMNERRVTVPQGVIVFISFSMPDESIVAYLRDAKKIHANVVIRGLVNNSFKATFLKMTSLVKQAGGGGVDLNPMRFKQFAIHQVPAVVALSSDTQYYDVVYGDIPLYNALKIIRDHGDVSQNEAEKWLDILGESSHA